MGNQIALVQADAVGFERLQIAVGGLVIPAKLVVVAVEAGEILAPGRDEPLRQRCHGDSVLAEQFGGDALANLGLDVRVDHDLQVGVAVRVDEAGSNNHATGIDDTIETADGGHVADGCDSFLLDDEAGRKSRLP